MRKKDVAIALIAALILIGLMQPEWLTRLRQSAQRLVASRGTPLDRHTVAEESYRRQAATEGMHTEDLRLPSSNTELKLPEPMRRIVQYLHEKRNEGDVPSAPPATGSVLSGVITMGGKPPKWGRISVARTGQLEIAGANISPTGSYRFEDLRPGPALVQIRASEDGKAWRDHTEQVTLVASTNEFNYDFTAYGAYGSIVGTVTGIRADEFAGVFAIQGEFSFSNVTEDDLYDLGDIADAEARCAPGGTFSVRDLNPGRYTVVAISSQNSADRKLYYASVPVDVRPGSEARVTVPLN